METEWQVMRDPHAKRFGPLPNAAGTIARLAYTRLKEAGCDPALLLKKAGLTLHQIGDPSVWLRVRDQISFLNLAANVFPSGSPEQSRRLRLARNAPQLSATALWSASSRAVGPFPTTAMTVPISVRPMLTPASHLTRRTAKR
jgi:hypothetical protein